MPKRSSCGVVPSKTSISNSNSIVLWAVIAAWCIAFLAASGRRVLILFYAVQSIDEVRLEPFLATYTAIVLCILMCVAWSSVSNPATESPSRRIAFRFLSIASIALVFWLYRCISHRRPEFWELLWISGWSSASFGYLLQTIVATRRSSPLWIYGVASKRLGLGVLATLVVAQCLWWFIQSLSFYRNFLLGFNDFGHFIQRVANTVHGNGILLESPVLPTFWDHFNPGLLLLVPIWYVCPNVSSIFFLQAAALSGSSLLVYRLARQLNHSRAIACLYGLAWLVQPCVGQMNLAYSYGWHPITFAIPLLLGAISALLELRFVIALLCILLAVSMEEGVFIIVGLTAGSNACLKWLEKSKWLRSSASDLQPDGVSTPRLINALSAIQWSMIAIVSFAAFWCVYRFSGLAEFQTARFVALGNSPYEIVLSPILRPHAFWGRVLQWENLWFVLALTLPCGVSGLAQGWRYVLPVLLPLAVLIMWDHVPAHCIAYQYPATLLPILWYATLSGSSMGSKSSSMTPLNFATQALVASFLLSLWMGQHPFSQPLREQIELISYEKVNDYRRRATDEDGLWLTEQIAMVRSQGDTVRSQGDTVLATGRIAAHFVGIQDIETVGQYIERRERLSKLPDRLNDPISHYQWVIIDHLENFQQTQLQSKQVNEEVKNSGKFDLVASKFAISIWKRRE